MGVRQANFSTKLVPVFFLERIAKAVTDMQTDEAPEWSSKLIGVDPPP